MAYALLYIDNASVLKTFDTLDVASHALNAFVDEHPDVRDEVALLELDQRGRGTGDYIFAESHSPLFA
jgi:hypothetical protein